MSSLKKRIETIEMKTSKDDEPFTWTFHDGTTWTLTGRELAKMIKAAQGTYFKPVTLDKELPDDFE